MPATSRSSDNPLSPSEIQQLRRALVEKRDALLAAQRASLGQQRKLGEPESEDADFAEQIIEQSSALRLAKFDGALLTDIEHALTKMEAGTYGFSEDSGEPIPLARLKAVPWARRTEDEEEVSQLLRR
jgi:DnaK suppressor protein